MDGCVDGWVGLKVGVWVRGWREGGMGGMTNGRDHVGLRDFVLKHLLTEL